jgi:hypothetical protein
MAKNEFVSWGSSSEDGKVSARTVYGPVYRRLDAVSERRRRYRSVALSDLMGTKWLSTSTIMVRILYF